MSAEKLLKKGSNGNLRTVRYFKCRRLDGEIKDGMELIGKRRPSEEAREAIECDLVLVG